MSMTFPTKITTQPSAWDNPFWAGSKNVVCITGSDGSISYPEIEGKKGPKIRVWQQSCYICHLYSSKTINT
jgi:hypothetical protein